MRICECDHPTPKRIGVHNWQCAHCGYLIVIDDVVHHQLHEHAELRRELTELRHRVERLEEKAA